MLRFFYVVILVIFSNQTMAWEDHAKLTKIILNDWIVSDASTSEYLNQTVKAESLQSFLNATKTTLPSRMLEIERWARNNEQAYKSLPDQLIYQPSRSDCDTDLEVCFKKALRMNLDVPLKTFIYDPSAYYSRQRGFTKITDLRNIMPKYIAENYSVKSFTLIPKKGRVRIADVIATSSDQPDFGFDTFLYEDSRTSFGEMYGYGTQPMGNPTLPFNSQMQFHMSAYHEDPKILALLPRLKENYPDYRAYLYFSLSRFAAENKHAYWSAVFLGWGLHYIQDMTQPYHSKITYGLDTNTVLNAIMEIAKNNYIPFSELETLQINRHIVVENLTNHILSSFIDDSLYKKILYRGLMDKSIDAKIPPCDLNTLYLRNQVSLDTVNSTSNYLPMLQATIPSQYINEPAFHADTTMSVARLFSQEMDKTQRLHFSEVTALSLRRFGAYTRACIAAYGIRGYEHA